MRSLLPVFCVCVCLFASCAKEDVETFDDQISIAQDYRVDAAGDTFYRFYMPNAFTPNSDGLNDLYLVYGTGFDPDHFEMRIFTRENNLVYYTDDVYHAWDGRQQGYSERMASQLFTVEIFVDDTAHEQHHYIYNAMLYK